MTGGQKIDLFQYHLTEDWSWYWRYAESMGEDALKAYINKVYQRLDKMHVGDQLDVLREVRKQNLELFIKAAGWYQKDYRAGNHDDDVTFNRRCTIIFKYRVR